MPNLKRSFTSQTSVDIKTCLQSCFCDRPASFSLSLNIPTCDMGISIEQGTTTECFACSENIWIVPKVVILIPAMKILFWLLKYCSHNLDPITAVPFQHFTMKRDTQLRYYEVAIFTQGSGYLASEAKAGPVFTR